MGLFIILGKHTIDFFFLFRMQGNNNKNNNGVYGTVFKFYFL